MTTLISRAGPASVPALPGLEPLVLIDERGHPTADTLDPDADLGLPSVDVLLALHRAMVLARRLDTQFTALTKQGRLAVYPSAHGQEASEIGAVLALRVQDWLFPTYRDTVAVLARGVAPVQAAALLQGSWHCGYDPYEHRVAPQCTPLATNALHAVGLAYAARLKHEDTVALVMLGDGATSEGDTHEALNFAGVWKAPVVFFVQNNGYAISVPLRKQTAAPSLAHKGVGYGLPALRIDGNDAAAVYAAVSVAVARAAAGGGPTLIEAVTYRMQAHTNADDDARYRDPAEVARWRERDPVARLTRYLTDRGLLDDSAVAAIDAYADVQAGALREQLNVDVDLDPGELFDHVLAAPSAVLQGQRAGLLGELAFDESALDEPDPEQRHSYPDGS